MSSVSDEPNRVVVYRLGSLGDTVVALPCFHLVAQAFPRAERIALTNFPVSSKAAPLEAVLGDSQLVHRSVAYPVGIRSPSGIWELASRLRSLKADTLVYLTPSRGLAAAWRDVSFFRMSGFKKIIGAPLTTDLQENRTLPDGTLERECDRLLRCLAPLGQIATDGKEAWDLRLTETDHEAARLVTQPLANRPYLAINMGGKIAEKDWGIENWQHLLSRLSASCGQYALLIVGAAEDSPRAALVGASWPGPVVDACGRLTPRASAAAMSDASLFVGHDSGPLHLAACIGVTCVGLFGFTNRPKKWHPPGDQHRIIHKQEGVMSITVQEVAEAVESRLRLGLADIRARTA